MIVIISEVKDLPSDLICRYLDFYDEEYVRINKEDVVNSIDFSIEGSQCHLKLEFKNFSVLLDSKRDVIFFRRGAIVLNMHLKDAIDKDIANYYIKEYSTLHSSIFSIFCSINSYDKEINCNDILHLNIAQKLGFKIPKTRVITSKLNLAKILKEGLFITKPIGNRHLDIQLENEFRIESKGTSRINLSDIHNLDEYFSPILIQEEIEKNYEVRVFVFLELIFAMAIYSQGNSKTELDYRNYDGRYPNRCIPIALPNWVEIAIFSFMKKSGLDSGSIDLIYSKSGDYYFLEVNPCGQFTWLSQNCNYNIEYEIAKALTQRKNDFISKHTYNTWC